MFNCTETEVQGLRVVKGLGSRLLLEENHTER